MLQRLRPGRCARCVPQARLRAGMAAASGSMLVLPARRPLDTLGSRRHWRQLFTWHHHGRGRYRLHWAGGGATGGGEPRGSAMGRWMARGVRLRLLPINKEKRGQPPLAAFTEQFQKPTGGISRSPNRGDETVVHTHRNSSPSASDLQGTDPGVELLGRQLIAEKIHALLPKFHGHGYPPKIGKAAQRNKRLL